MSFGDDEDILQDFLVEAGEILERLSQQLVDLEQRPDDKNLLNAIFRGFHTVKGGAGFLSLTPMVQCCHVTENLFDILRNGKRTVTSELMDVVLQALDMVNQQFELVSAPGQAITQFTQGQISLGQVRFVHDGGEFPPIYDIQVLSDGIALSPPPQSAQVNFTNVNDAPVFVSNQLTLLQGEILNINAGELSASDVDSSNSS